MRLIFEVFNLHYVLQSNQRRTLKPVFVDANGVNVLPRMDDSPAIRLLRRRLHRQQGKFFNVDMITHKKHIDTGYDSSFFSKKDQVWCYRIDAKCVDKGE